LKKIQLKKVSEGVTRQRIGYKLAYQDELNPAQYEAVFHNNGAALVIAGAGTGKTRTLIYRLARLVEDGVPPDSILLLTFTRKASAEMLRRAAMLLDGRCERVSGGTFHSFALNVLRPYSNVLGIDGNFTVLDQGDSEDTINLLRMQMRFDKSKKRFPLKETLQKIFNLATNRCLNIEDILLKDFPYFFEEYDNINRLHEEFIAYKSRYNLMDYDDLLLNLHRLLSNYPDTKKEINRKYTYVMVDEYQDTNRLQHEIVKLLAGNNENVMAVGDDSQSIYSFRGAEFQNIITFPESFKDCQVYKIEENYRSTQPILSLTNEVIIAASFQYEKELFTRRMAEEKPKLISAENERQQSLFIVQEILELREQQVPLEEIAVLFRSAFLSFDLEIELNRANIPFKKFGGMKFVETAHIKDMTAFFKILSNPKDAVSLNRALLLLDGVGPRTSNKIIEMLSEHNVSFDKAPDLTWLPKGKENINGLFNFLKDIGTGNTGISEKANLIADYYKPLLKNKYDDWQKRWKDIEMFITIAERYRSIPDFLNDMAIEPPIESVIDIEEESKEEEFLTLTTIHSAKGLEWKVVFLIWVLDGRFPSAKSADSVDSLEEERRLFYVACTRAKDYLYLTYPTNIYDREQGIVLSKPSRFLDGIDEELAEKFMLQDWEMNEN
jgi:DNA helicase-2/ATP-dependent DNA helicase PcrA